MRSVTILPLAAALVLAGCGSEQPAAEKQSAAEVKSAMEDMVKPMPGQYRSTMKLVSVDIPGIPASQAEKMKGMLGASEQTTTYCLTQAEADKGFEEATKKLRPGDNGNCNYERFSAENGKLDAKLTCNTPGQAEATMEMAGTILPDRSDIKMTMQGAAPGMPGSMKMVMEVQSERTGECA